MPQPLPPPPPPKSNFWFILGREPLLSAAELAAVFGMSAVDGKPHPTSPWKGEEASSSPFPRGNARLDSPSSARRAKGLPSSATKLAVLKLFLNDFDAAQIIRRLGGTIKIGVELGANLSEEELLKKIIAELKTVAGKINFGLSFYGPSIVIPTTKEEPLAQFTTITSNRPPEIPRRPATAGLARNDSVAFIETWGKQIKKILKNENYSVRYVFKREINLSSVTVEKNGLTGRGREFLITQNQNKFSLAKTLAVQPFEEFGARDFGRPGRDDLSGMLPPKLALMMVNLAKISRSGVVLDPFCGSGTILTEALLLGYKNLIGSDVSVKAISDTEKNMEWTKKNIKILQYYNIKIFKADVARLSNFLKPESVDCIITESYLGKPLRGRETEAELRQQAEELKKLYLTAFEQFKKVLKKDGTVIFLVPRFRFKNNWLTIDLKSAVEKLGFKAEPLLPGHVYLTYARANQLVGREVWKFKRCHSERM